MPNESTAIVKALSEYETKEVEWLWNKRFQKGKLSLLIGDPGKGKSFLTLDMAARVSTGTPWPTGDDCPKGDVILVTGEDDPSDTIKPRLEAMGADTSRIHIIEAVKDKHGIVRPFHIKDDQPVLESTIADKGSILVIIDPLLAYMSGVDAYKYTEVYAVLGPLAPLCSKYGCTIVGIIHMNKNSMITDFGYRAVGSIAFVGACRSMHMVVPETTTKDGITVETGRRLFTPLKMTNKDKQTALSFHIVDSIHPTKGFEIGKLVWEGEVPAINPGDLLSEEERTLTNRAKEIIARWMEMGNGAALAKNIEEEAKGGGIKAGPLNRAKKELGIVSENRKGWWWWVREENAAKVA